MATQKKQRKGATKRSTRRARDENPRARTPKASMQGKTDVDGYVAALTQPMRELCARVLSVVVDSAPDAVLAIQGGQPVWDKNGPFAWLEAHKTHVGFGFWRGAQLHDDRGLLQGGDDSRRYIKLVLGEDIDVDAISLLIHQAVALNVTRGDPTKQAAARTATSKSATSKSATSKSATSKSATSTKVRSKKPPSARLRSKR